MIQLVKEYSADEVRVWGEIHILSNRKYLFFSGTINIWKSQNAIKYSRCRAIRFRTIFLVSIQIQHCRNVIILWYNQLFDGKIYFCKCVCSQKNSRQHASTLDGKIGGEWLIIHCNKLLVRHFLLVFSSDAKSHT